MAYAGTNIPYYLMARGLRNEVYYVNIDRHRDWLLHDYHRAALAIGQGHWQNSRPGWDRMRPDFQAWLDNLDAKRIELLVVTRVNPGEGAHNVADVNNFPIDSPMGRLSSRTIRDAVWTAQKRPMVSPLSCAAVEGGSIRSRRYDSGQVTETQPLIVYGRRCPPKCVLPGHLRRKLQPNLPTMHGLVREIALSLITGASGRRSRLILLMQTSNRHDRGIRYAFNS